MAQPKPRFGGAHTMEDNTPPSERLATEGGNSVLGGECVLEHNKRIERTSFDDDAINESREPGILSEELLHSENGFLLSDRCEDVSDLMPDIEKLLRVFRELGINALPKSYTKGSMSCIDATTDEMASTIVGRLEGTAPLPGISCDDLQDIHECHGVKTLETAASLEENNKVITSKNLFLKDRKGQFYLVIVEEGMAVDLKNLKVLLNATRNLSFADQGSLQNILGVLPGGVTPLAMMRDTASGVRLVISDQLVKSAKRPGIKLAFHPLDASLQVEMSFSELTAFLLNFGHQLEVLKLNDPDVDDESKKRENLKQGKKNRADRFGAKSVQVSKKNSRAVKTKSSMLGVEFSSVSTSVPDGGNELDYISEVQFISEVEKASRLAQTEINMDSITVKKLEDFVRTESTVKTESGSDVEKVCHLASGILFGTSECEHGLELAKVSEGECGTELAKVSEGERSIEPTKVSEVEEITVHPPGVVNVLEGEPEWNLEVNGVKCPLCDLGEFCSNHSDGSDRIASKDRLPESHTVGENSLTCRHKQGSESIVTHAQPHPQAGGRNGEGTEVMDADSTRQNSDFDYRKLKYLTTKSFDRKGKLKSFLKKKNSSKSNQKLTASETDSAGCVQTGSSFLADPGHCDHHDAVVKLRDRPVRDGSEFKACATSSSAEHVAEMLRLKPRKLLPEVEEFYNSLAISRTRYREFDLSCSDSLSMGPSIGCKTLLLKDVRQNIFLIITHEFYELDYGRLRNAIKPKKKLKLPGDGDVMAALGVDPSHLTPFALLNQRARDVRVLFTQKILPGKIILSIQHPFASGHRILMTSSALQAYLDNLGVKCESVQEKTWSARYDTIFTRFEGMTDVGDTLAREGKVMISSNHLPGSNPEHTAVNIFSDKKPIDDNLKNVGERRDRDTPQEDNGDIDSSSPRSCAIAESTTMSSRRLDIWEFFNSWMPRLSYFQQDFFRDKGKELFMQTPVVSQSLVGVDGSSVDPRVGENRKSLAAPGRSCRVNSRSEGHLLSVQSHGKSMSQPIPPALSSPLGIAVNHESVSQTMPPHDTTSHVVGEVRGITRQVPEFSQHRLNLDSLSQDISTEDVQNHLDKHKVIFSIKKNYEDEKRNDIFDDNRKSSSDNGEECNEEDDECDNSEVCRVIAMQDMFGTPYIIICSETDWISTKRFCRIFNISSKLTVCEDTGYEKHTRLKTLPFCIAISRERTEVPSKMSPKMCIAVLTSSIYIDSETNLKFVLNDRESEISMTSHEFESYSRKMGFEIWYMP